MIRFSSAAILLGIGLLPVQFEQPAVAGDAGDFVSAGYDLYQLTLSDFFPNLAEDGPETGYLFPINEFYGIPVQGVPLGLFDFGDGNGAVPTGLADTIVRRTTDAELDNSGDQATVPIEIVALSLRSVDPVNVSGHGFDHLYIGLADAPSSNAGEYTIFGNGEYESFFDISFDVRFGSPSGPLVDSDQVQIVTSEFSRFETSWDHFPIGDNSPNGPDHLIDGINFFLNGSDQSTDFFLDIFSTLSMTDDAGTTLDYTMADSAPGFGGGGTPDDPVLPGDTGGIEFQFNDVPGGGLWFDPPTATGFIFETDGNSDFVSVILPPFSSVPDANSSYLITSSEGSVLVASGGTHSFGDGIQKFTVTDINPAVDGSDPLAFPTFLLFDEQVVSFTMTPIPEPGSVVLASLCVGLACVWRRGGQ